MVPVRKFPSSQTFRMLLQPSFTNSCRKGAGKAPQGPQLSTLKWKYSKQEQKAMNKHKLSHNTVKMVPHRAPSLQNKRYHVLINAIYIYVYICIYTYTYTHIHTHIYIYILHIDPTQKYPYQLWAFQIMADKSPFQPGTKSPWNHHCVGVQLNGSSKAKL